MDGDARAFVEGLKHHFAEVKDPRIAASCQGLRTEFDANPGRFWGVSGDECHSNPMIEVDCRIEST
jgi:hypothetical protein